jgi:hypothetical protein
MIEPSDQEALATVETALAQLATQLANAEATEAAAGPRLKAAQAALVPLLAEQRQGTATASTAGVMPVSSGGYHYQTGPLDDLARRLERAQHEFEDARLAGLEAGAGVTALRVKFGRLKAARRTILERQGAGGGKASQGEGKA